MPLDAPVTAALRPESAPSGDDMGSRGTPSAAATARRRARRTRPGPASSGCTASSSPSPARAGQQVGERGRRSRRRCRRRSRAGVSPAPDDGVEVDRRRVGGEPDQHRAAAGPQQRGRPAAGWPRCRPRRTRRPRRRAPAPRRGGTSARRPARLRRRAARRCGSSSARPARSRPSTAACSVISPIVPAPRTTARSTGPPSVPALPDPHGVDAVRERLGQHGAPRVGADRERGRSRPSGTVTRVANAPGRWTPISWRRSDSCSIPGERVVARHERIDGRRRRAAPGRIDAGAEAPTTWPAKAWPMTSGGVRLACAPP